MKTLFLLFSLLRPIDLPTTFPADTPAEAQAWDNLKITWYQAPPWVQRACAASPSYKEMETCIEARSKTDKLVLFGDPPPLKPIGIPCNPMKTEWDYCFR